MSSLSAPGRRAQSPRSAPPTWVPRTALVTRGEFGGMEANDGPVPVRTLAHAARLIREARQLGLYGISVSEPVLTIPACSRACARSSTMLVRIPLFREQIDSLGVAVYEQAGAARFADPHTVETANGLRLQAEKIIICTGGVSRRLSVPGVELTATHSERLGSHLCSAVAVSHRRGATGAQVASIFNAFGSRIQLFQAGPRILPTEDEEVSACGGGRLPRVGHSRARELRQRLNLSRGRRAACG